MILREHDNIFIILCKSLVRFNRIDIVFIQDIINRPAKFKIEAYFFCNFVNAIFYIGCTINMPFLFLYFCVIRIFVYECSDVNFRINIIRVNQDFSLKSFKTLSFEL